ncbi:MAG: antitoxin VbhA family protein [Candidatus Sedimenticola sp. (ex Thyasira tokunagai)]
MNRPESPFKIVHLGSTDVDDQVCQAVASATLEGLKPTQRAIDLVQDVAAGKMSGDDALTKLRGYYARHA